MKKILTVLIAVLILVGCGSKASGLQTLECNTVENGMEMLISLGVENEELSTMGVVMEVPYEEMGITKDDVDEASKAMLNDLMKAQFSEFGELTMDFTDTGMSMDVKLTKKGLTEIGAFDSSDVDLNGKIDINQLKEAAEDSGAKCTIK